MPILTIAQLDAVKGGYGAELPGPARDLKLMARRGFTDQLHYQRFRFIMQGIAGYPHLSDW